MACSQKFKKMLNYFDFVKVNGWKVQGSLTRVLQYSDKIIYQNGVSRITESYSYQEACSHCLWTLFKTILYKGTSTVHSQI